MKKSFKSEFYIKNDGNSKVIGFSFKNIEKLTFRLRKVQYTILNTTKHINSPRNMAHDCTNGCLNSRILPSDPGASVKSAHLK